MVSFEWLVQKTFTPRQLNRSKSIKGDVLVTFQKSSSIESIILDDKETETFFKTEIENWLSVEALDTNEIYLRIMKLIFSKKIIIGDVDIFDILIKNFSFTNNTWVMSKNYLTELK
jgi:hypothetical protein